MEGKKPNLAIGTLLWIPCDEAVWKPAEIIRIEDGKTIINVYEPDGSEVEGEFNPNSTYEIRNADIYGSEGLTGLDDLTELTHLHEPAILHSLNVRFDVDRIYTYTGPILIAVNPFKYIMGLYDDDKIDYFLTQEGSDKTPHIFASAQRAYSGICQDGKSQTILISGESGAGKTISTRHAMRLLAHAGSRLKSNAGGGSTIEKQVLQSNPLLETFGNAKTLRNDNSSRFGKFINMQFDVKYDKKLGKPVGNLLGARIHSYLLESVRVCHQLEGERNYHSFYYACAAHESPGCTNNMYRFPYLFKDKYKNVEEFEIDLSPFSKSTNFNYLTQSSCHTLVNDVDLEELEACVKASRDVGLSVEEINAIFLVLGFVLNLGNVEFDQEAKEESKVCKSANELIEKLSEWLQCEPAALETSLTNRTLKMKQEVFLKPLNFAQAEETRDALGQALYNALFKKIVQRTNESLGYDESVDLTCGVLDIFGFECFEINSFEQLCINFTNERLQQFFNTFIFKEEEKLYIEEEIEWSALDFPDNQDCVDTLQQRPFGIFCMLDEECVIPGGKDAAFCNKIKAKHADNHRFGIIKTRPDWFSINHFAGSVHYCSEGFMKKNKDTLSDDVIQLIKTCQNEFAADLFINFHDNHQAPADSKAKKHISTVSLEFRNQLTDLMNTIQLTEPHFVRCVKPNSLNKPDIYERANVCEQLRYGGVLQAVQVSRAGYPVRGVHKDMLLEYLCLSDSEVNKEVWKVMESDKRKAAQMLFGHLDKKYNIPIPKHASASWHVGKTLVFFKREAYDILSQALAQKRSAAATLIQAVYKGIRYRVLFAHQRRCAIYIQARIRGRLARVKVEALRQNKAATIIQKNWHMAKARALYTKKLACVLKIQSVFRGSQTRKAMKTLRRAMALERMAAYIKTAREYKNYRALRTSAIRAQRVWRIIQAKRQLRKLRLEAKDINRMIQEKQNATKELENMKAEIENLSAENVALRDENKRMARVIHDLEESAKKLPKVSDKAAIEEKLAKVKREVSETYEQEIKEYKTKIQTLERRLNHVESSYEKQAAAQAHGATSPAHDDKNRKLKTPPTFTNMLRQSINNLFGDPRDMNKRNEKSNVLPVLLRPCCLASEDMISSNMNPNVYTQGDIRPVQEVHDIDSAVTYICFGHENIRRDYILLAAGGKDGSVIIYRCHRTEAELRIFDELTEVEQSEEDVQPDHSITVLNKLSGHNKAITSIFFTLMEENIVTTSVDRTVRFWSVKTGDMLKVFSDSSPALVAACLPFNPSVFVAANSNAILRVVNIMNGHVIQKLKFDCEVRAMRFDYTGLHLIAGTRNGSVHVLEAVEATQLKFRFKIGLGKAAITHITYIPENKDDGVGPCIAVNSCDSSISILECIYTCGGSINHLTVKQRLKIPQSLLPLRSCYSEYGGGWVISASEDRDIHAFSLAKGSESKAQLLKHHRYPVLAVAVTQRDTLLASADTCGKIVLWRRFDYSHLRPDKENVVRE